MSQSTEGNFLSTPEANPIGALSNPFQSVLHTDQIGSVQRKHMFIDCLRADRIHAGETPETDTLGNHFRFILQVPE